LKSAPPPIHNTNKNNKNNKNDKNDKNDKNNKNDDSIYGNDIEFIENNNFDMMKFINSLE